MKMTNKQKATLYCEKYGIIPYSITSKTLTYYANYPAYLSENRKSYKVVVTLSTMEEKRIELKRWTEKGNVNVCK